MNKKKLTLRIRWALKKVPVVTYLYSIFRFIFHHTYREDGLLTIHNSDFTKDGNFLNAYNAALKLQPGTNLRWRAKVLQWAGVTALNIPGDFVECGVHKGFLSKSLIEYVGFHKRADKTFFLVDTYSGLVEELVSIEDQAAYWNEYSDTYQFVCEAFSEYKNVRVVKGIVPYCLPEIGIKRVAYLSIDMNCVEPEVAALEFFWPLMSKGGIVILDDYGFSGHEAQKHGADKFAEKNNVEILPLPTGQGLLIKLS